MSAIGWFGVSRVVAGGDAGDTAGETPALHGDAHRSSIEERRGTGARRDRGSRNERRVPREPELRVQPQLRSDPELRSDPQLRGDPQPVGAPASSPAVPPASPPALVGARSALVVAVKASFAITIAGQWLFLADRVRLAGTNAVVFTHLVLAIVVMVGGPLQFIPAVRRIAPSLHRWNGRVYGLAVLVISATGLVMVWSRERPAIAYIATTMHAVLLIIAVVFAARTASARNMATHRRWAVRLFMVVNAGWFFRIGVLQWVFAPRTGSFLNVQGLADYALPLILTELYLRDRRPPLATAIFASSVVLTARVFVGAVVGWQ